jgi:pimeloyl-ACP methyl ester carboxylesterase
VRRPALLRGAWPAALALLAGCAAPIPEELLREIEDHLVCSDAEGAPVDAFTRKEERDFERRVDRMLAAADVAAAARESLAPSNECCDANHRHPGAERRVRRLLLHVHGGLNSDRAALERAAETVRAIDRETGSDWHHPIFLTWPSGGIESVRERLLELRSASHYPLLGGALTAPFVLAYDLLLGVARSPRTIATMALNDFQVGTEVTVDWDFLPTWEGAEETVQALADADRSGAYRSGPDSRGYRFELGSYRRGAPAQAWRFVRYVGLSPFKYVLTPLVIDGLGRPAWEVMLHRASNTLRPTTEFEMPFLGESDREELERKLESEATGAFARFLRKLDAWLRDPARDPAVCWELTLIGHSMGAIILNDALQLHPELPVRNLVYMAPACSIAEAEETIVPFLTKHCFARFHLLTLHPTAETDELVWNGWGDVVARGSLLEWIDLWYDAPSHSLDRRLGKWNNAMSALHVFRYVRDRVSIKAFAVDGDSKPQEHGQFDAGPFWRREVWEIGGRDRY